MDPETVIVGVPLIRAGVYRQDRGGLFRLDPVLIVREDGGASTVFDFAPPS
jgi:hypothetical protein